MKVKLLLHCFLAVSVIAGCKLSKHDKETIVKVTPEFAIDIFEKLGDTREFQFKVSTLEKQECTNFTISTNAALSFNRVTLNVIDLLPPTDCVQGYAPAYGVAEVGILPSGYFNLDIHLKNAINNDGMLSVYTDSIVVDLDSEDGLDLIHKVLCRIPETAIWGYTAFDDNDSGADIAAAFKADLTGITQPAKFPQGYYGYFDLDENDNLILSPAPAHIYFQTFLMTYNGDIKNVEDLVQSYRAAAAGADVEFAVFTGTGKTL